MIDDVTLLLFSYVNTNFFKFVSAHKVQNGRGYGYIAM